jgi:hypothetical protein
VVVVDVPVVVLVLVLVLLASESTNTNGCSAGCTGVSGPRRRGGNTSPAQRVRQVEISFGVAIPVLSPHDNEIVLLYNKMKEATSGFEP